MMYAIVFRDAFIPHNLQRSTSYALHSLGTIVSRRLYWHGNSPLDFSDLTMTSFTNYFIFSAQFYMIWFIPYSTMVFLYSGYSMTLCREIYKLGDKEEIPIYIKTKYLFHHLWQSLLSICLGIVLMHSNILDNMVCFIQVFGGILHGGLWYNKFHNKLNKSD
jgi:hypothetical protein